MREKIKLGIGFATGRKNFRNVLNSYIYSFNESKGNENVELYLFVAYDVEYHETKSTDYTNLNQEVTDSLAGIIFFGAKNAQQSVMRLINEEIVPEKETKNIFGKGYAGKRNAILYGAIDAGMDYLLFLDDDEYPVAVTKTGDTCLWSGQEVVTEHIKQIKDADITNGHHCGYISPIPKINFNETLKEQDFAKFIGAISNDILNWDKVKNLMESGGVTYGDTEILSKKIKKEVEEINGCKFISGSNLCINLRKPKRTFPFYNPPGARGEDTFLSTMLEDRTVIKVPCYTFHDGFDAYKHLLDGVLPRELGSISAKSEHIVKRFYQACIGWVRYKPLLMYLTNPKEFHQKSKEIQEALDQVSPKLSQYFDEKGFLEIPNQFKKYQKNAERHSQNFEKNRATWQLLMEDLIAKNKNQE
ncbi:MAG: hypothetical protein RR495_07260 [Anaerovoracaceae bacterium]